MAEYDPVNSAKKAYTTQKKELKIINENLDKLCETPGFDRMELGKKVVENQAIQLKEINKNLKRLFEK